MSAPPNWHDKPVTMPCGATPMRRNFWQHAENCSACEKEARAQSAVWIKTLRAFLIYDVPLSREPWPRGDVL